MNSNDQNRIADDKLQFFSRITANVTHEINNVFSVIKENSGLLSDLLKRAEKKQDLDPEKLWRISNTIQKHLVRGKNIIKNLNSFAHSVDNPVCEFNLMEAAENIVTLSERLAYRKNSTLKLSPTKEQLIVRGSPFLMQQTIFLSIMFILQSGTPPEEILIGIERDKENIRISIKGAPWDEGEQSSNELSSATSIIKEFAGNLQARSETGELEISLPRRPAKE